MKKIKKLLTLCLMTTGILAAASIGAGAEWRQDSAGWWYTNSTGYCVNQWLQDNGAWYHFDDNGYMQTGWVYDFNDSTYYHMNNSGAWDASSKSMPDEIKNIYNIIYPYIGKGDVLNYLGTIRVSPNGLREPLTGEGLNGKMFYRFEAVDYKTIDGGMADGQYYYDPSTGDIYKFTEIDFVAHKITK